MSAVHEPAIYDELLDLLADSANAQRVLQYRLSAEQQERLDSLLEKNRAGTLTSEENAELDEFERVEHLARLLKARLRARQTT